jgi:hypothetical protein
LGTCATTDPSCGVLLRAEPQASVTATSTAPPSSDSEGRKVTYQAQNAYDGDPQSAWRTAGDGRGQRLVLTFDRPTNLTGIGIVNGYAKTDPGPAGTAWYPENRRIIEVRFVFDDGSSIVQDLVDMRPHAVGFQGVPVRVTPSTVTIEILKTTAPGSRDYRGFGDSLRDLLTPMASARRLPFRDSGGALKPVSIQTMGLRMCGVAGPS